MARVSNWITKKRRLAIYLRDNFRCGYCGKGPDDGVVLSIDHIVAVASTGKAKKVSRYLITCCRRCNSRKRDRTMRVWYARLRDRYGMDIEPIRRRVARQRKRKMTRYLQQAEQHLSSSTSA